MTFNFNLMN